MKRFTMPLLFKVLKLNPKMKVASMQTITLESFDILKRYKQKSDDPVRIRSVIDLGGGGEGVIGQILGRAVTAIDIREDELLEAPEGPFKVVADARALPFEAEEFYCATAFYFLMYLKPEDLQKVFEEVYRVLMTSGLFVIWDATIPKSKNTKNRLFVVPLKICLPEGVEYTAYGAPWPSRILNEQQLIQIATEAGFVLEKNQGNAEKIQLIFKKV